MDWRQDFDTMVEELYERLDKGERDYGNKTLSLNPSRLLIECKEEIEDAIAYLFFIWRRLDNIPNLDLDKEMVTREIADMMYTHRPVMGVEEVPETGREVRSLDGDDTVTFEGMPLVDKLIECRKMRAMHLITELEYDRLMDDLLERNGVR